MPDSIIQFGQAGQRMIFCRSESAIFLKSLCGLPWELNGQDGGPKGTRGLFVVDTIDQHFEAEDLRLLDCQIESDAVRLSFCAQNAQNEYLMSQKFSRSKSNKITGP